MLTEKHFEFVSKENVKLIKQCICGQTITKKDKDYGHYGGASGLWYPECEKCHEIYMGKTIKGNIIFAILSAILIPSAIFFATKTP